MNPILSACHRVMRVRAIGSPPSFAWSRVRYVRGLHEDLAVGLRDAELVEPDRSGTPENILEIDRLTKKRIEEPHAI